jgi:hypothetical protein
LNNSTFKATQFMSLAVHPADPNFTIGGTQDNGTIMFRPNGTWNRVDFGDGGFAAVDQSATDTTSVTMYHTYFNNNETLQGYAFTTNGLTPTEGTWTSRGCRSNNATVNGISCASTSTILFYAPLELGPGSPNTVYYGSDRLYRSADRGLTHTVESQAPIVSGQPISAIGISPQNDKVRLVGLRNGDVYGTIDGSSTLVNMDPANTIPAAYVGRVTIDPTDSNIAYVSLGSFSASSTVWRTANLMSGAPTWSSIGNGMPSVPVNAFEVDPHDPRNLYAGTDIGVYMSTDSGASWTPLGTGLPRVAVFDIVVLPQLRKLRIATHGRGMWELGLPTASVAVKGRVITPDGRALRNAVVSIRDGSNTLQSVASSSLGFFSFENIEALKNYTVSVSSKRFRFNSQMVPVNAPVSNLEFAGQE